MKGNKKTMGGQKGTKKQWKIKGIKRNNGRTKRNGKNNRNKRNNGRIKKKQKEQWEDKKE
jgi:hypothetical protein